MGYGPCAAAGRDSAGGPRRRADPGVSTRSASRAPGAGQLAQSFEQHSRGDGGQRELDPAALRPLGRLVLWLRDPWAEHDARPWPTGATRRSFPTPAAARIGTAGAEPDVEPSPTADLEVCVLIDLDGGTGFCATVARQWLAGLGVGRPSAGPVARAMNATRNRSTAGSATGCQ